jgi:hypothetical protein
MGNIEFKIDSKTNSKIDSKLHSKKDSRLHSMFYNMPWFTQVLTEKMNMAVNQCRISL